MKLFLLSDAGSIHTYKWVKGLSGLGIHIFLFSLNETGIFDYSNLSNTEIFTFGIESNLIRSNAGGILKIRYLFAITKLKELVTDFSPDIVHAHYATSYGLLGALLGFHPYIISVWGSDIFSFPKKSSLHKNLLRYNLRTADVVLSTSYIMKNEVGKHSDKDVQVVPFGVNTKHFKPAKVKRIFDDNDLVIGIVKSLEKIYGIDILVRAFKIFKTRNPAFPVKLLIVGGGSQEKNLLNLTKSLSLENDVVFTGYVKNEKVVEYLNMMDITVFPSLQESFGVSALEASACEKPVIAANSGGLAETVKDNETGILVKAGEVMELVSALEKLAFTSEERERLGRNGRQFVINYYEFENCLNKMYGIYENSSGILKLS